jgi:histidyl-tRNA synthetase
MSRLDPISGFPEWTPEGRVLERHVVDSLRDTFELYGFIEIETRAVEPLERLAGDSDAAKEIYVLRRLRADADDGDSGLGLHFDLTVPFARYVEEFSGRIAFPFRRYQIQKVWRGERPQEGRFREFYQADIDIVDRESLPSHVEAEVAIVMAHALARLPIPSVTIRVNSRAVVGEFYRALGVTDVTTALRIVDKLPKIGAPAVRELLIEAGVSGDAVEGILGLATVTGTGKAVEEALVARATAIGGPSESLREAIAGLRAVVDAINVAIPGASVADLSIARGLDYYTGCVFETFLEGHEDLGSICSGGRYDSLIAGGGFPGVGMSIGVSRLVSRALSAGWVNISRVSPSVVVVAVNDEDGRKASDSIADRLRARGIAVQVSPNAAKFGKQIQYAERRGIPFVWFPAADGTDGEVKDIRSGDQNPANPDEWMPPPADLKPRVERR